MQALRFVDGNGEIFEVSRDDPNQDNMNACLISLGVLGILSTVTFRCDKTFNICGSQVGTLTKDAKVDIFSDNPEDPDRTGLPTFLKETEYTRILWWPQSSKLVNKGEDRVQIWQAKSIPSSDDFQRDPYAVFDNTEIMMLYSYLMILIGNIDDMEEVHEIAKSKEGRFMKLTMKELMEKYDLGVVKATAIAGVINTINTVFLNLITTITDAVDPDT